MRGEKNNKGGGKIVESLKKRKKGGWINHMGGEKMTHSGNRWISISIWEADARRKDLTIWEKDGQRDQE